MEVKGLKKLLTVDKYDVSADLSRHSFQCFKFLYIKTDYNRVSIIQICGDYFNKPESLLVRMSFALR